MLCIDAHKCSNWIYNKISQESKFMANKCVGRQQSLTTTHRTVTYKQNVIIPSEKSRVTLDMVD